jgi:2',3'-cyclic-nucleotide 2'-phosphodiesterase (5'-nucleotidase family)
MPDLTHLTVLHTNDIHGRLQELARIATLGRHSPLDAPSAERITTPEGGDGPSTAP